jgi:hypothetical protein
MAINNNTTGASVYDLGKIVQSDSIAQLNSVLKESEAKVQAQKQQEMQANQQMQQEQLKAQSEENRLKREYEETEAEKDRQNQILLAEIKSAGYGSMVDVNKNEESDYVDAMKEIRSSEQYQQQTDLQRDKQSNENMRNSQKMDIEREKLAAQREIADKQLQIARENKNKFDNKKSSTKK